MLSTAQADKLTFSAAPPGFLSLCEDVFADTALTFAIIPLNSVERLHPETQRRWLHEKELSQLATFSFEKRSREWLGGRICAKQSAEIFFRNRQKQTDIPKRTAYTVQSEESGRPYFSQINNSDLNLPELSISHSKAYAAAISSRRYCGIDIQYCVENLARVQEKFCTSLENHILQDTLPELSSLKRLTQLWSAKEAAKKMLSPGGIPGFHELELLKLSTLANGNNLLFLSRPGSTSSIQVLTSLFRNDYGLAICCEAPDNEVCCA